MKIKFISYLVVAGCMVGGASLMVYADVKKRSLYEQHSVETIEANEKKPDNCKNIS